MDRDKQILIGENVHVVRHDFKIRMLKNNNKIKNDHVVTVDQPNIRHKYM